jgi:hypothetical protein
VKVYGRKEKCIFVYLVNHGIVQEQFDHIKDYRRTKGTISNICNVISPDQSNLLTLNTLSECSLHRIRREIFVDLMRRNKAFELKCYQQAFPSFVRYLESKNPGYSKIFKGVDDSR